MKYVLVFLIASPVFNQAQKLALPVSHGVSLSSNFAELRRNHFHMGLDMRTNAKINYSILAIEDGYVSRIKISPYGYGKVIYINHPHLGLTSVYAHLNKFEPAIEDWANKTQYSLQVNTLDTILPSDLLPVRRGHFLAYSGNSGSSGGPHLHFEIRDMYTERAINPMIFYPQIKDKIPPTLSKFVFYHVDKQSVYLAASDPAKIKGQLIKLNTDKVGIGVSAYDRMTGSKNKFGIYSLKVFADDILVYAMKLDSLDFGWGGHIKSVSDYSLPIRDSYKGFYDYCGFNLSDSGSQNGIIHLDKMESKDIRVEVRDFHGNLSSSSFKLISRGNRYQSNSKQLDCRSSQLLSDGKAYEIHIPENGLAVNKYPKHKKSSKLYTNELLKLTLFSSSTAVLKPYEFRFYGDYKDSLKDKIYLEIKNRNRTREYLGKWEGKELVFRGLKYFGLLKVKYDVSKPYINPKYVKSKTRLIFKVTDQGSDIDKYNLYINGKWRKLYYDAKYDRLIYNILLEDKAKKANVLLEVEDGVGNKNSKELGILL